MVKYCFSIIMPLLFISTAFSADKIYLNNGLVIDGTIVQIDIESVTVKYGDKELTRTLHKGAIKVIIYEDGTVATFNEVDTYRSNSDSLNVKLSDSLNVNLLEERVLNSEIKTARIYGFFGGIGCCIGVCITIILLLAII